MLLTLCCACCAVCPLVQTYTYSIRPLRDSSSMSAALRSATMLQKNSEDSQQQIVLV